MNPLPLADRRSDRADNLRLLVCGAQALLEDVLEDMRGPDPLVDRVAMVCALLDAIQDKAVELSHLCEETRDGA